MLFFFTVKPPQSVYKWMSAVLQAAEKESDQTTRTPNQCHQIIKDAAETLSILPEQLRACRRESMQKTARKLAFVLWPDAVTRSGVKFEDD
jgi:hypothetical protein